MDKSVSLQDLLFKKFWVSFSVLVVFTSILHAIFKKHEPTFFGYLYGILFLTSLFVLLLFRHVDDDYLSKSIMITCLGMVMIVNFLLGIQIIIYRLLFHNLKSFPGPLMATFTQFWIFKEAYLGRTRFTLRKLGLEYGDWVRIGPNELYTGSVEALWVVMGPKGWSKGASYDSGITKDKQGGDSLLTLKSLEEHAPRRRLWEKAFTPKSIASYLPTIESRIEQLLSVMNDHVQQQDHNQKHVDLGLQLGYFAYDSMTDLAFGGGTNLLLSQKDEHGILNHIGRVVQQVGINRNIPWITPLINSFPNSQRKQQIAFREFTKSMFMRRYKQGLAAKDNKDINDIFHHLLGEGSETGSSKLNISELMADSSLIIIAGADSTRTVLIALFLYLIRSKEYMKRLQIILDEQTDFSTTNLARIPFLDACLKEALRLQPPSPSNLQRVCPTEGSMIEGKMIPGGTKVRFSNWAMQRDARYFESPDRFWPERWLTSPSIAQPHDTRAFYPFMIGPGTCVAKNLAMMEMRLVAARLLKEYDIQFAPGFDDEAFERTWSDAYLLLIEEPFLIQIKPRCSAT